MLTTAAIADLAARRDAVCAAPGQPTAGRARNEIFSAQFRSSLIERNGKQFYELNGTAAVVERWYEMWDMFGPYQEKVARGAFDQTLAANPDVAFLLNHRGMTMARTKTSRTLELFTGDAGNLDVRAYLNPERQDVRDLITAIEDGDVDQMSFAFQITEWAWNENYDQFTILSVDLDRGDVSAVNYGANPNTSIGVREALGAIDTLNGPALLAARERINARIGHAPVSAEPVTAAPEAAPAGRGLSLAALELGL